MSELQDTDTTAAHTTVAPTATAAPVYLEDADGRAIPVGAAPATATSTGRLDRTLRRAIAARPADGLTGVGLLVGPDVPDHYAPSVTLAVNGLLEIAARYAGARRVDIVVGLRSGELVVQAQYDGTRPGADPALDPHAARLRKLVQRVEDCGGSVEVDRTAGRNVTRLRSGGTPGVRG